ncbi:MAG: phosphoribosylanthranilate isomerase [Rhodospirillaceae bacterium]|nr:phosphoribosylanthranilate isomerase [Rhodospirillaceae bacterium]
MSIAVKICGLTTEKALTAAVDAGADYVGFVFFRRSPRYVDMALAASLVLSVPRHVTPVGLFVDPTDAELETALKAVPLSMLQLHGAETPARVGEIAKKFGIPIMKAVGVSSPADVVGAAVYDAASWLLFDAKPPKDATRPGGNAKAFDWALMQGYLGPKPWMLAGGLTAGNVQDAITASKAKAVDVSSGVESRPGVKSAAKIRAFIKAVRALGV